MYACNGENKGKCLYHKKQQVGQKLMLPKRKPEKLLQRNNFSGSLFNLTSFPLVAVTALDFYKFKLEFVSLIQPYTRLLYRQ